MTFSRAITLHLPKRTEIGAGKADFRAWAEEAYAIRRLMDNNPREMSVEDVHRIYREAF